jgi:hypothetical protein
MIFCFHHRHLLPGQDKPAPLPPCQEHPGLWFRVGLGYLRLGYLKFIKRRSVETFVVPSWCQNTMTHHDP